jgi:acetoin utilization protein AcuB
MRKAIRHFMTPAPHCIGAQQSLARAHEMMRHYRVRHLPVLDSGKLVGMVSQRDLYLVETLKDVDPKEVRVDEAMTQDAYTVGPTAQLGDVAANMAEKKIGCAVVVDGGHVIGVFSTTDALRALVQVLR